MSNTDVSLEFAYIFGDPQTQRSLILPWVTSENNVTTALAGTLIFDQTDKKVKVYQETDDSGVFFWKDLSTTTTGTVNASAQNQMGVSESNDAKVFISSTNQATNNSQSGVLILSDNNKAMVLPLVDLYSSVINPAPGSMVYDTTNDLVCFFNGTDWSFWAPK